MGIITTGIQDAARSRAPRFLLRRLTKGARRAVKSFGEVLHSVGSKSGRAEARAFRVIRGSDPITEALIYLRFPPRVPSRLLMRKPLAEEAWLHPNCPRNSMPDTDGSPIRSGCCSPRKCLLRIRRNENSRHTEHSANQLDTTAPLNSQFGCVGRRTVFNRPSVSEGHPWKSVVKRNFGEWYPLGPFSR